MKGTLYNIAREDDSMCHSSVLYENVIYVAEHGRHSDAH